MVLLKRLNKKTPANSILESVVALTIISICLYFSMMIFTTVLSPKSSPKFYNSQNKANEFFYLSQLQLDSMYSQTENIIIEEESVNATLKKVIIHYKDSAKIEFENEFYILNHEE